LAIAARGWAYYLDFRPYGRVWSHRGIRLADEATAQRVLEQIRGKVADGRALEEVLVEYLPVRAKPNLVRTRLERWLEVRRRETGESRSQTAARRRPFGLETARRGSRQELQAKDGFGGEHPCSTWSRDPVPETPRLGYAPPQNRKKRWPEEAPMEGWFSRAREEQHRYETAEHRD
jgi:hypothetical protein